MFCWTPEKRSYRSRQDAVKAATRHHSRYTLEPYLCNCGRWHLRTAITKKKPYKRPKYPVWKGYK